MKLLSLLLLALCAYVLVSPLQAQQVGLIKLADMVMIELKEPAESSKEITNTYTVSEKGTLRLPKLSGEIQPKGSR